eukprot:NODE_17811_length_925_cov_2.522556.p2 GENE.NODE_17811_length_925_cov_2.522556~~NODE_17811_length_925_cov_2.522556.p2  ORF type:complete len:222 (-),score=83.01 NODE_17811_length_925_cov_2.522556:260-925(-)
MMPFGGGGCGGGLFGGLLGGNMFGAMDIFGGGGGFGSFGGGGSSFTCQTMSFSSHMGNDGQMRTEHHRSSTVSDPRRGILETHEDYTNSEGIDRRVRERRLRDQGRRMVHERDRNSGDVRQEDTLEGVAEEEGGVEEFNRRWQAEAEPHLPRRNRGEGRRQQQLAVTDASVLVQEPEEVGRRGGGGGSDDDGASFGPQRRRKGTARAARRDTAGPYGRARA